MRSLADRYRDLFPARITSAAQDATTGAWRHAWVELTPGATDAYDTPPDGRTGTTAIAYALENNNQQAAAGRVVWLRHRDEGGGQIHYEFNSGSGGALGVSDEGNSLTAAATSLNFVGAGVTATASGGAVTVTIPGGGGSLTVK